MKTHFEVQCNHCRTISVESLSNQTCLFHLAPRELRGHCSIFFVLKKLIFSSINLPASKSKENPNHQPPTTNQMITNSFRPCKAPGPGKFISEKTHSNMCISKHVCPCCSATYSRFSSDCPANLPHHQLQPQTNISPLDGIHQIQGWCEKVSALCNKCQMKQVELEKKDESRETMQWRKSMKGFLQKSKSPEV